MVANRCATGQGAKCTHNLKDGEWSGDDYGLSSFTPSLGLIISPGDERPPSRTIQKWCTLTRRLCQLTKRTTHATPVTRPIPRNPEETCHPNCCCRAHQVCMIEMRTGLPLWLHTRVVTPLPTSELVCRLWTRPCVS